MDLGEGIQYSQRVAAAERWERRSVRLHERHLARLNRRCMLVEEFLAPPSRPWIPAGKGCGAVGKVPALRNICPVRSGTRCALLGPGQSALLYGGNWACWVTAATYHECPWSEVSPAPATLLPAALRAERRGLERG